MAKRILVPLDRSPLAEALIPLVADLARGGGATVRLLHVAPEPQNRVTAEGRVVAYVDQESTAGRSAVRRAVLGSVAAQVVRRSAVPVLLYHPWGGPGARAA